ncbi:PREDICTED: uncharacterized protein LOC107101872 [Cyprinodon variegatus]|uniref:uncharacterized protein LOC107101872 n=1 Tax=Cyprinodon variegatus TaxID=28743 RepID=UPI00074294C6|nr:PREDICTED: uncharacterized protein LOC107101872 [Cyprinodon variegatus]
MHESSPLSSTGLRSQDSAIPGRLASLCSLSGSCLSGYVPASTSCVTVRPQSQLGKELSGSISDNHLSWDASGLRYHDGPSICSQGRRHTPACPSFQTGQGVSLHHLPANAGQTDISHSCRALRAAPSASFAAMAQQLSPRCQAAHASQADGDQELPPCPSSLVRRDPFVQWCSNSVSKGGGHHGCQPHGLGCRVATQSCSGSPRERTEHINVLELRAVHMALGCLLPHLEGRHVLIRTDNTSVIYHINRLGGTRSARLLKVSRDLLEWAFPRLCTLCAAYLPGRQNHVADSLSRQAPAPGEWSLHRDVVRIIWNLFGQADLFATEESTHCPYGIP